MSTVKHIIKSMTGGYAVVAVQAVIGVLMVPYLISDSSLGLNEYGLLMLIQSTVAILSVLLDGWRLETARLIGKSINTSCAALNEINLIALILTLLVGSIYLLILTFVIPYFKDVKDDHLFMLTSFIFVVIFAFEQIYYAIDSYFHAIKMSWISNIISIFDSVSRALIIILIFSYIHADIVNYAISILLSVSSKYLVARVILRKQRYSQEKVTTSSLVGVAKAFKNAPTQTLQGLSPYIIYRGAVILSGHRLGAEQAAVVSIIIQTIKNYFVQACFSGLRPFILPFLSSVQQNTSEKKVIDRFFLKYQIIVLIIGAIAAATASIWFPLWLGDNLGKHYKLMWIVMIGYSIEVALLFYYYEIIASGKSVALAYLTFVGAIVALVTMIIMPDKYVSVEFYMWIVTVYICYWSFLVLVIRKMSLKV